MNKKGFTLIELLAVVTLIAIITIIAMPKITNNIKNKKVEIDAANQKLLAAATETYIENNQYIYNNNYEANGSTYCIPVQILIDNGILETPFKNVNGQEIDYSNQVKATYQAAYNSFNYELVAENECQEIIQYVSRPQLSENMIPVIYNDETNTWVKADKNTHWYNYSEKKWANAVLVKELRETADSKSRDEYKQAPAGTPILEQDILAQFVWIPRFRYKLFSSNTQTPIDIVFENVSTPKSTSTTINGWLTHPAFTYNNKELPGIWVGKYETSNENDNPIIKNQSAWTNIDYVEANKKAIEMANGNNIYGISNENTHMIRNSEWGAAVYLTNSIYGNLNNNSTTGNNTGIYNLSGNKEFVIADNENENALGYALNETKNWTTNNSYITNDNLYLTRGNNSIYNYQNSKVQDQNTTFRIALTNSEMQNQNYQKKYIVTFDANGGTVSQTSKEVSYHEPYGALPTPTRAGYTFVGWRGKNLFSSEWEQGVIDSTTGVNGGSSTIIRTKNYISVTPGVHYAMNRSITTSYMNVRGYDENKNYIGTGNTVLELIQGSTGSSKANPMNGSHNSCVISLKENVYYLRFNDYSNNLETKYMMVEGDEQVAYEPYQEYTSNTIVTEQNNHTLYAIWEPNS